MLDIKELKARLDIIDIASKYCDLKRNSRNTYKAVTNPLRDERTSSLCFYGNTQKYYDYGTSEGGDVIDFIAKAENLSLSEVMAKYNNDHLTPTIKSIRKKPQRQTVSISNRQLAQEFDRFESLNIHNNKHYTELLNVIPYWLFETADKDDIDLFMSLSRYDKRNNTIVAAWCKNSLLDFEIITYKRRRYNGNKWMNRKDTHPNQTSFNRIYDEQAKIYIIEGMHDALTAVLLGLNFIAIPTTSFKNIDDIKQAVKPTDEVVFICEDRQGYKAMSRLANNISNSELVTFVKNEREKIDLSDFVNNCKTIKEVKNAIEC